MSKTPYEIRLELLKMANEILVTPVFQKRQALTDEYHSKITDTNRATLAFPTLPDFPGTEDVIKEAERLNQFVSKQ